jgi:hypothetical protein
MSKFDKNIKKRLSQMEGGQVLIVVAVSIVVIVAIVGLALDVGMMFIGNARMRRAVDAAALAAALQYHPTGDNPFNDTKMNELDRSAIEFLTLNGIHDANARVEVCDTPEYHPAPVHTIPANLCPSADQMQRKLVRVLARGNVSLAFLPVIGINSIPITANAISETASVDVVLVIDRSESMTWDAAPPTTDPPTSDPMRDPSVCNAAINPIDSTYTGYCRPFYNVKLAAVSFVNQLYFPYDRVSVVTFDKRPTVVMELSNDKNAIINKIKALTVFQGEVSDSDPTGINSIYSFTDPSPLPSRWYAPDTGFYWGLQCAQTDPAIYALHPDAYPDYPNPAPCTTTNIGAGMYEAGIRFNNGHADPFRNNSLWVVILLTDGVANAGYTVKNGVTQYFCPGGPDTGGPGQPANTWVNTDIPPICNDGNTKSIAVNRHSPDTSVYYDAEDYAYDAADFVATSQNALIFTIGLGAKVKQVSTVDGTPLGELYLKYAANVGHGSYAFDPTGAGLVDVFRKIAQSIATRLTH